MSGAKSRRKGSRAELEFCALASEALGDTFKRKLGQARDGGGDVDIGRFLVEVKAHAKLSERTWWKQAVASAKAAGKVPALAYKLARKGWVVAVPHPAAWATGACWREEWRFTQRMDPEGFWLTVREAA
jgi:hypothetical protein